MSIILSDAPESGHGISTSLDALCTNYYQAIKRHVSMHAEYEVVEDLTQEVFFRAVRAYPRLVDDTHLYAYLVRIANNVMIDYRRRPQQKYDHCDLETITELHAHAESDPFTFCDARELSPALRSAWLTLPLYHKEVITLLTEGYKARDIARRMGWSDLETWRAIKNARDAFRRRYKVYHEYQEVA